VKRIFSPALTSPRSSTHPLGKDAGRRIRGAARPERHDHGDGARGGEEAAHGMLLPSRDFHDGRDRRPLGAAEQCDHVGLLGTGAHFGGRMRGSVRTSSPVGNLIPSVFAVLKLRVSSILPLVLRILT
jgi:hypothetical protein